MFQSHCKKKTNVYPDYSGTLFLEAFNTQGVEVYAYLWMTVLFTVPST